MELKDQLAVLQGELKTHFEKADSEQKKYGTMLEETKSRIDKIQTQADAIDAKLAQQIRPAADTTETIDHIMKSDDGMQRLLKDKRGSSTIKFSGKAASDLFERKTTITSGAGGTVSESTTGVLPIDRLPDLTREATQVLSVRKLLTSRPTTFQVIDFVKVNSPMTIASPVAEAANKPENAVTFVSASERIKTIATVIPATRQVLDDWSELLGYLKTMLPYYVDLAEEQQLLSGDGTNENLHGLITQATAFSTGLLSATRGWNDLDIIGRSIQQITVARELPPTFIVLHPQDWWSIRLAKDNYGRYLLGDAQNGLMANLTMGQASPTQNLFGLNVVPTTSIAAGTFLVGSGSPMAAEIRDRLETTIDISTEHASFFVQNLVMIRCEKRLALIVRRPASFVSGSFTNSPA